MAHHPNQSDVACILNLIEVEYRAAQRGLTGFAASATHAAISARMDTIVGDDAIRLVAERLEALPEEPYT